jgi:hypothetical protein
MLVPKTKDIPLRAHPAANTAPIEVPNNAEAKVLEHEDIQHSDSFSLYRILLSLFLRTIYKT